MFCRSGAHTTYKCHPPLQVAGSACTAQRALWTPCWEPCQARNPPSLGCHPCAPWNPFCALLRCKASRCDPAFHTWPGTRWAGDGAARAEKKNKTENIDSSWQLSENHSHVLLMVAHIWMPERFYPGWPAATVQESVLLPPRDPRGMPGYCAACYYPTSTSWSNFIYTRCTGRWVSMSTGEVSENCEHLHATEYKFRRKRGRHSSSRRRPRIETEATTQDRLT